MAGRQPAGLARRSLFLCRTCRNAFLDAHSPNLRLPAGQARWITKRHIDKIKIAEEEWQLQARQIREGKMKSMMTLLEERGYVNQIVGQRQEFDELLTARRVGIYAGIDPTAPSMHVGHMVPFMALAFLYIHGYSVYFLLGGVTAAIGDPIGRTTSRAQMSPVQRKANVAAMHLQLKRFAASVDQYAARRGYQREWAWKRSLVNNVQWWTKTSAKEFLEKLGRFIRIGPMLGRDTVKTRLEGDGMSFAEFSYPLAQAWDWWQLYQRGVQVQIGGADQFGNILAGVESVKTIAKNDHEYQSEKGRNEAIDKRIGERASDEPFGFTVPLLTTATGEKFGKSAGNAVWLDAGMTSPFQLYQFFLRSDDANVEKYLKLLTFLPLPEITELMQEHEKDQSKRIPHHKLAQEFVELVHGLEAAKQAEQEHRQLYTKGVTLADIAQGIEKSQKAEMEAGQVEQTFINPVLNKHAQPTNWDTQQNTTIQLPRSLVIGQPLSRVVWSAGLVSSRAEGQRLINARGLYMGAKADAKGGMDEALSFTPAKTHVWEINQKYVMDGKLLILRVGKWKMKIINIIPDDEYHASGQTCPGWETEEQGIVGSGSEAPAPDATSVGR